jgi:putative FmdB family regulatory protein
MPTYEYQCRTCSHRFETWQKMTDEPLTICPECGGPIRRVLFPAGIVFKGSGFYKTDNGSGRSYSSENGRDSANGHKKSEAASESKTTESGSGSSDTASASSKASESKVAAETK